MRKTSFLSPLLKYIPSYSFPIGFLVCLIYCPPFALAQSNPTEWEYFTYEEGLSTNDITGILQDEDGYLWIASINGLLKYDGHNFYQYKNYNKATEKLSNDYITFLLKDRAGNIWIGTYNGLNKYDHKKRSFSALQHSATNKNTLAGNYILYLMEDSAGYIWIVTRNNAGKNALNRLDPSTEIVTRFEHDPSNPNSLDAGEIIISHYGSLNPHVIMEDAQKNIWIGTTKGLHLFNHLDNSFKHFTIPCSADKLDCRSITNIYQSPTEKNILWIGTGKLDKSSQGGGLYRFDKNTSTFEYFPHITSGKPGFAFVGGIFQLKRDPDYIWVLSLGISKINIKNKSVQTFFPNPPASNEFYYNNPNLLTGYYKDEKEEVIWLCPFDNSPLLIRPESDDFGELRLSEKLFQFDFLKERFTVFDKNPVKPEEVFGSPTTIASDFSGGVWVATNNFIYRYKRFDISSQSKPQFESFLLKRDPNDKKVMGAFAYAEIADLLWIATSDGLKCFDKSTKTIRHFAHQAGSESTIGNDVVRALWYDKSRRQLWIGHDTGLNILNDADAAKTKLNNLKFKNAYIPELQGVTINAIQPAERGKLWIATVQKGLFKINIEDYTIVEHYQQEPNDSNSLSLNDVELVFEDSKGQIWIGTDEGGLCKLLRKNGKVYFERFMDLLSVKDIHEDKNGNFWVIAYNYSLILFNRTNGNYTRFDNRGDVSIRHPFSVAEDKLGRLWLSTTQALVMYDPKADFARAYHMEDGLQSNRVATRNFKASDGKLYLTTWNGYLQSFTPENIRSNPNRPLVAISKFTVADKNLHFDLENPVILKHREHTFTIEFVGLEFTAPKKNTYRYQLEGADEDWINAGTIREARYTQLSPGKYTFKVMAANNDGIWSESPASLAIIILPPWWRTWWAYALYMMSGAGLILAIYNYQRKRWQLQAQLEIEQREAIRLKELDNFKSNLYANITHEFRTPLTVMLGNVEEIGNSLAQSASESILNLITVIKRNGEHLLYLINQMLDLARLESGAMTTQQQQADIIPFIHHLYESFESLAYSKQLKPQFQTEVPQLVMDYDPDKIFKIVSNLLSNAIKFSAEGGRVVLKLSKANEQLILQVEDWGVGIAAEAQPFIFDRFYQADTSSTRKAEGAGIGLALTKELVQLLGGKIAVQSALGEGSVFTVWLPITNQAPVEKASKLEVLSSTTTQAAPHSEVFLESETGRPYLLVVEDNQDLAQYIVACISDVYNVFVAKNGKEGMEKAFEVIPDIILSDVMMPEADGFELCETLKNDERTSHIPIILLTAKATIEDRIAGLQRGADDYLAKPFHKTELQIRLQNLIQSRQKLQARYSQLPQPLPATHDPGLQLEDAFLKRVVHTIEAHFSDDNFDVERLSELLYLHRSQVYRKVEALTGKTPSQLIQAIRLQKAEELLLYSEKNMTEIALSLGFSDSAHFSRTFKAAKGIAPTAFRKAQS